MSGPSFAEQALAWLLTYLLHGTLLLGLAWLVSKPLSRWSPAAEETVWKLALVGALFTASLQLAAGWEPVAGRWGLADFAAPAAAPVAVAAPSPGLSPKVPEMEPARRSAEPVAVRPVAAVVRPVRLPEAPAPAFRLSASAVALGVWALGAAFLLAGYVRSFARLGHRLQRRPRVIGGTLHAQLRTLVAEAGLAGDVRLTCSSRVPVPVAFGVWRPEICLPPKALAGLTDEQQEGMLAHELAHLVRRDPFWLVVSHALACVFFFQPLNWVARRRLRELSEMLSDEWAVSRTGRPLSLAGCLAEVAGWTAFRRRLPVPGMADRPSHLAVRIHRLLDRPAPESPARRIWLGAAMGALLIVVAGAAPAVSAAGDEAAKTARETTPVLASATAAHPAKPAARDQESRPVIVNAVPAANVADADAADVAEDLEPLDDLPALDVDLSTLVDSSLASLGTLDGDLAGMTEDHALSEEERKQMQADMEKASEHLKATLQARMEQLSRDLSEQLQGGMPTAEMRKIEAEMEKLGQQAGTAAGQRDDQRKAMEDLRRQLQELAREYRAEQHEAIEEATREMREEIQQEMQAARDEMRRAMDQRRVIEQQERKERHEEMNRTPKKQKMVLRMDFTGKFELVPEEPGC